MLLFHQVIYPNGFRGMDSDMNVPVINGSADIAALRKQLDAQGIKAPK